MDSAGHEAHCAVRIPGTGDAARARLGPLCALPVHRHAHGAHVSRQHPRMQMTVRAGLRDEGARLWTMVGDSDTWYMRTRDGANGAGSHTARIAARRCGLSRHLHASGCAKCGN